MEPNLRNILDVHDEYVYFGGILSPGDAYTLLTSEEANIAEFCGHNSFVCGDNDFWEALFAMTYPDQYDASEDTSVSFVGEGALVIMPSQYREPVFWRDLYTDLTNVRKLDYGVLWTVENLFVGEKPFEGKHVKTLADSFWTLLVVLENVQGSEEHLLPLVLLYDPSFLQYASAKAVKKLGTAVNSGSVILSELSEESLLYAIRDERMQLSERTYGALRTLASGRIDPSTFDRDSLLWASTKGHEGVVRLLLSDERVDVIGQRDISLSGASKNGHLEVVRLLVGAKGPWWTPGSYALVLASWNGHTDVVRFLLEDGRIEPSFMNYYALKKAVANGHFDTVRLLLGDSRVIGDPDAYEIVDVQMLRKIAKERKLPGLSETTASQLPEILSKAGALQTEDHRKVADKKRK